MTERFASVILSKNFKKAQQEGRVCRRCGWMITKVNWRKGFLLCAGCWSALQGVKTPPRYGAMKDEPEDKTGEML